jgi:hypothetical protein
MSIYIYQLVEQLILSNISTRLSIISYKLSVISYILQFNLSVICYFYQPENKTFFYHFLLL